MNEKVRIAYQEIVKNFTMLAIRDNYDGAWQGNYTPAQTRVNLLVSARGEGYHYTGRPAAGHNLTFLRNHMSYICPNQVRFRRGKTRMRHGEGGKTVTLYYSKTRFGSVGIAAPSHFGWITYNVKLSLTPFSGCNATKAILFSGGGLRPLKGKRMVWDDEGGVTTWLQTPPDPTYPKKEKKFAAHASAVSKYWADEKMRWAEYEAACALRCRNRALAKWQTAKMVLPVEDAAAVITAVPQGEKFAFVYETGEGEYIKIAKSDGAWEAQKTKHWPSPTYIYQKSLILK